MAQAISEKLITLEEVMPLDEAKKIAEYFPKDLSIAGLSAIKEKAPANVSYSKLRMVLAWLQLQKGD
jgi:hypothetical protein